MSVKLQILPEISVRHKAGRAAVILRQRIPRKAEEFQRRMTRLRVER
jgi:hypothetical protein